MAAARASAWRASARDCRPGPGLPDGLAAVACLRPGRGDVPPGRGHVRTGRAGGSASAMSIFAAGGSAGFFLAPVLATPALVSLGLATALFIPG